MSNPNPFYCAHQVIQWLRGHLPVSRARYDAVLQGAAELSVSHRKQAAESEEWYVRDLQSLRKKHSEAMGRREETIAKIVKECSDIRFDRDRGDMYSVQMTFDPRMMAYGRLDRDSLEMIAREFAREVVHEIMTAKFVEPAGRRSSDRQERIARW